MLKYFLGMICTI